MQKVIDQTEGKLDEIKAFAKKIGKTEALGRCLAQLNKIRKNTFTNCYVWLFTDFAPMSLYFAIIDSDNIPYEREDIKMNGGIIFHGDHDAYGSGSFPTLSVCVNPTDGWSIHT